MLYRNSTYRIVYHCTAPVLHKKECDCEFFSHDMKNKKGKYDRIYIVHNLYFHSNKKQSTLLADIKPYQ
jgi:hypothetical protein